MGKINPEFLAISGVQSILNFFDGKHKVEFNCSDFSLGDLRNVAVSTPTDRIQIKVWNEKEFSKGWKEAYEKGFWYFKSSFFCFGDKNTERYEFFEKRMSSKKIPFLPKLFGLDENATLQQILAKSEELNWAIHFKCYPHFKKKNFQASVANPNKFERGPTKEFHPFWEFDELKPSVHPNVNMDPYDESVSVTLLMDEDFGNPCFHDIVPDVTRETDVVREIREFIESHARPETETEFIYCKYYSKDSVFTISHIEGNIVYSFKNSFGFLSYKPDLAGKEIFKRILEVTPKGTFLHPCHDDTEKVMKILNLADGKPEQVSKDGVLILEWSEVQMLVYEGCVFVRHLDETLSKDCFEIDRNFLALRGSLKEAKEMVDATMKSSSLGEEDEDQNKEKSLIISSGTSLTQKPCTDEPKVLPKPRICSSTATAEQISGNFNQKTYQKKGLTQKPDIGNQANQHPPGTKSQGKPKFVLVDVDEKSNIKKGNKKPNKTRKDVERLVRDVEILVPDKTKIDIIRISLIATVCCLIGAGIWFVKVPGEKGEFIDVTQRRLSRSHKNKEPRKKNVGV